MKFFLLVVTLSFSALTDDGFYLKKINYLESEQIKVAVNHFRELHSKSLVSRVKIQQFVAAVEKQPGKVLSGKQIEALQKGILQQIYLREKFYRLVNTYKRYAYLNGEETMVSMDNRLKGALLALASACVLCDNYLLCLQEIQDSSSLRRLVNKGDGGLKVEAEQLQLVVDSFNSRDKRKQFREALDWFIKHRQKLTKLAESDNDIQEITNIIKTSPSVQVLGKGNMVMDYFRSIKQSPGKIGDSVAGIGSSGMNTLSKFFGNSVGAVQFRKGRLYGDKKVEANIIAQLKPLDVILEKTPFRLTDKFIPGHFGHVAIWLGTEKQLKEMGMWDNPLIVPYHKEIKLGYCVLEALRDGVQLNTLAHFLDVDDIAVLRKSGQGDKECIERACRQIGKEYDFNFDVETADKIVCSELVYHVFVDVEWPTEKALGRYTISPDNVAIKALGGGFDMKLFIHDGKVSSLKKYRELVENK